MRFAMVTTFYPPFSFGGDGAYVRALSRALVERGHQVEVIHCADAFEFLNGGSPTTGVEADPGIVVHSIRTGAGALSPIITQQTGSPGLKAGKLSSILDRGFDVIHFHNISLIGGPGVLRLGRAQCKLFTLHEHWLVCPTHIFWKNRERACDRPTCFSCSLRSGVPPQLWRYTGMRDKALLQMDRLLSPSHYTAERHKAAGIKPPIDVLPLFSALEPEAPIRKDRGYFLCVGRVTAPKGVDALVRAVAAAPDLRLRIVGQGDLRDALARAYTGASNIEFIPQVPQERLAELYLGSRALIVPSAAPETFGLTTVEAAAHGVPSIVRASAGGAVEFATATGSGVVYADETELVSTMRTMNERPELGVELGAKARQAYLGGYTRRRHVDAYLGYVAAVVSARSGRR